MGKCLICGIETTKDYNYCIPCSNKNKEKKIESIRKHRKEVFAKCYEDAKEVFLNRFCLPEVKNVAQLDVLAYNHADEITRIANAFYIQEVKIGDFGNVNESEKK
jgi:hypothetical protein